MSTEYVILTNTDDGGPRWQEIARVSARSTASAIRRMVDGEENGLLPEDSGGVYVAVPARSWKPVTVKVETKTALKFS